MAVVVWPAAATNRQILENIHVAMSLQVVLNLWLWSPP